MTRDADEPKEDDLSDEALLALLLLIGASARKYLTAARTDLEAAKTKTARKAWRRKWEPVANPEAEPRTQIDSRLIVASLAAYFWRVQRSMWTPAKRDLKARLETARPGQVAQIVAQWVAAWKFAARAKANEMRTRTVEILGRASRTFERQIAAQLTDAGYTPRDVNPKTGRIAEIAVDAEISRFETALGPLQAVAERADLLNQGSESVLSTLEAAGPKKAGSAATARETSGMVLADTQRAAFEAAGVQFARWQTQEDNLVRPKHKIRNGKTFDVAKGLGGIFPGQERNCRCFGVPLPPATSDPIVFQPEFETGLLVARPYRGSRG